MGGQLWTLFMGGSLKPSWVDSSRKEWTLAARAALRERLGVTSQPQRIEERALRAAICQYTTEHAQVLRSVDLIEARQPGLFLEGTYRRGIGIPDRIEAGIVAAERALRR